jgi:hypothetical protein
LLGLWQFQLIPKEDQLSYFQIAGENLSWPLQRLQLNHPGIHGCHAKTPVRLGTRYAKLPLCI